MERNVFLPCSQEHATGSCPKPNESVESTPSHPICFMWVFQVISSPQVLQPVLYTFLIFPMCADVKSKDSKLSGRKQVSKLYLP
jgi:hypothetical protein